ncbi:hypothetical protein MFLAVUS_003899 [Mucor flavus]|uniref:N-acetyltransferase domain-containing protein n=1 Tax=Mucor flavus TaxID=439312 RepID=A0ABP9YUE2_9FUNG
MRLNENLMLIGDKVALVPYKAEHVPKYHEWMKSPFLQEMTASDPLTLEEEYEMQTSWHQDEEKLTFIIVSLPNDSTQSLKDLTGPQVKESTVMVGDVNIFLNDPDNDKTFGEIEVMVAEPVFRRTGRGKEALKILMGYCILVLGLKTFQAKISLSNEPSISLFKSQFGFYQVSISQVFEEVVLEWSLLEPAPSKMDEYGNEIECYGSKASQEQRNRVLQVKEELIQFWNDNVKSNDYN